MQGLSWWRIARRMAWKIRGRRPLLTSSRRLTREERREVVTKIDELAPWFHNMNLGNDVWTNPTWEGSGPDYPKWRWELVQPMLPDVQGRKCLDIGCSSGFFALKLKELGAEYVLGIDQGEQEIAVKQARFAATCVRLDVDFDSMSVYDLAHAGKTFDIVLFLGVFYHLRHPLLALESIRKVCGHTLLIQTITTPHERPLHGSSPKYREDAGLKSAELNQPDFPMLRFVNGGLDGDRSCWFVPSPEAVLAMLNSSGFLPEEMIFPTNHEMIVRCSVK